MHVLVDVSVVPIGVGTSLSEYVAACQRVFYEAGLKASLHAYGTNVEGEWDVVFAAVKRCHEVVHAMGAPRVSTTMRVGTRTDRAQSLDDKIRSVRQKLGEREEP
ncbi:MAG: MTH1187 family thiamine-binding protein [Vicinamibacterales bacterium]